MIINLIDGPYFYFVKAIKITMSLNMSKNVGLTIDKTILIGKKVVISFFRFYL